ncbi:MAG: hypothetical protein K2Z81_24620, partial [Cyanobacteria bacterium]|nr:hypothetical protein [Cyanobacteriota bacterium]
ISSGLAMTVPYGVAAIVTRGALLKTGSCLKLSGSAAQLFKNRSFATVLGAGIYDGMRKPQGMETRLSNAAGGMLSMAMFERLNPLARTMGGSQQIVHRAMTGAVGATSGQSLSHFMAEGRTLTGDELLATALTGATMNVALPAVHEQMGRLTNKTNQLIGRGLLIDDYLYVLRARREISPLDSSPKLNQLIRENPWVRVVESKSGPSVDHDARKMYVTADGATPEIVAHELGHMGTARSEQTRKSYDRVTELLNAGHPEAAWMEFRDLRLKQEVQARQTEGAVAEELGRATGTSKAEHVLREEIPRERTGSGQTYEQLWVSEFERFRQSGGTDRPTVDYAPADLPLLTDQQI